MIEVSGGRAGPHEPGWIMAGYQLEEIEPLRQQLLSQNDYFQVQTAMQKLGIHIKRNMLRQVKRYMFDSYGIGFLYENYIAWRRLATRKGLLGDASYLIHEITEVEELQRIQSQTGFNFMGPKKFWLNAKLRGNLLWEAMFSQNLQSEVLKVSESESTINDTANGSICTLNKSLCDSLVKVIEKFNPPVFQCFGKLF